jgi:hypothetical protein
VRSLKEGAPYWVCVVPLAGVLSCFILWRNRPGAYWLLSGISVVAGSVTLFGLSFWQAGADGVAPGWGLWLTIPAGLAYGLIVPFMAMKDAVPMASPLVRWVYLTISSSARLKLVGCSMGLGSERTRRPLSYPGHYWPLARPAQWMFFSRFHVAML